MTDAAQTGDITRYVNEVGVRARGASRAMAAATAGTKSLALNGVAEALAAHANEILAANERDVAAGKLRGLEAPLMDRLVVRQKDIERMIEGVRQVDGLADPIGTVTDLSYRPSGIQVGKMRVPLGVIGIIYESRPNVTVDAACLCIKSGNACILRGGSEAFHSNRAIVQCVTEGLHASGLPKDAVQLIETTDRAAVGAMVRMNAYIDVLVPRGGKGLIERIEREATIPVIKHLDGVCHVYIDAKADIQQAVAIAVNSKTEKYAVCNAIETLLVDAPVAAQVLPLVAQQLRAAGVEMRGCARSRTIVSGMKVATESDWREEYLAPILAVRVVDGIEQAIGHINDYGSQHTDTIVTEDYSRARRFLTEVDSATVMVNASTQFADGFEFGLGAEIGISTNKLHARGPVGLEGLTTQKFVVFGSGQVRKR